MSTKIYIYIYISILFLNNFFMMYKEKKSKQLWIKALRLYKNILECIII